MGDIAHTLHERLIGMVIGGHYPASMSISLDEFKAIDAVIRSHAKKMSQPLLSIDEEGREIWSYNYDTPREPRERLTFRGVRLIVDEEEEVCLGHA